MAKASRGKWDTGTHPEHRRSIAIVARVCVFCVASVASDNSLVVCSQSFGQPALLQDVPYSLIKYDVINYIFPQVTC